MKEGNILTLLISLLIVNYIINENVTSSNIYIQYFITVFAFSYYINKKYDISLFISLITVLILTFYNYIFDNTNALSKILILLLGLSIGTLKSYTNNNIILANFVILVYIFISLMEYFIHKNIMHCNLNGPFISFISKIPFVGGEVIDTCKYHIEHHKDVNKDLSIDEVSHEEGMFMGWEVTLYLFLLVTIIMLISRYISNMKISNKSLITSSIVISILWCYLWNKIHISMHKLENNYSIYKGAFDENLFDLTFIMNILLSNHGKHHSQKGEKKGNYNIILLGADEWLYNNNKVIDNSEYCKKNPNEKVCK
jgi:hypothetical protein